jgi:hypothetical protein
MHRNRLNYQFSPCTSGSSFRSSLALRSGDFSSGLSYAMYLPSGLQENVEIFASLSAGVSAVASPPSIDCKYMTAVAPFLALSETNAIDFESEDHCGVYSRLPPSVSFRVECSFQRQRATTMRPIVLSYCDPISNYIRRANQMAKVDIVGYFRIRKHLSCESGRHLGM